MSPKNNNKQVSAAVRILQQKRDASARATHLMVKNDSLITYEKAFSDQADKGKFPESTFLERKIMSTKTSFKRIALVAASALAIAGFSAVPANATVVSVAIIELDASDAASTILYTTAGTEVTLPIYLQTATDATEANSLTITPSIVSQPAGDTLSVGAAGSGKVGMTTAGTLGANVATVAAATKWTSSVSAGVQTLAWSEGTVPAFADNSEQVVGTVSITPASAGRYAIRLTPAGADTTNTVANIVVYASGANGTVGTAGTGTTALTAQVGGQAAFTYTTPNGTATGTVYQVQSSGVGTMVGATGLLTDNSTAENPVPYNGTAGDFSAGAKWTTGTNTTSHVGTFTLQSTTAGTQTVSITKIDATTGSPVAVTSVTITWNAATSLNLTTLQVSTLTDTRMTNGDCTIANKAVAGHNGLVRSTASTVTDSGSICILAMNGNGAAKALTSLTVTSTGPGLIGAAAGDTPGSFGLAGASTDLDGVADFEVAGSGIPGVATYTVSAKSLNADGVTSTTLTGTVKVTYVGSTVGSATIDQATAGKYALADDSAATVVADFSLSDAAKSIMAGGATANLLVDSDAASTLTVDAAGETDASAAVTVSRAASVDAAGTETKGQISVDCAATKFEKLTIWLHFESNTVPSNKITVYCTSTAAETFVLTVPAMSIGEQADITVKATAGITGKLDYPVADAQTATFSTTQGTLGSTSAVSFKNGVATVKFNAPLIGGNVILTAKPASVTATSAVTTASGVSATLEIEGDSSASLALDAANAATDAANNAYDEAQNATQAASDALAAVTALAKQVKSLIASVKKLTKAVAKLS